MNPPQEKVPDGCQRFVLSSYERFPTLDVDNAMWRGDTRGSEPPGFYPEECTVVLPTVVYDMWREASEQLRVIEHMIREIEAAQRRFDGPPERIPTLRAHRPAGAVAEGEDA